MANFFRFEIEVYPASVESKQFGDGYDWKTKRKAANPIIVTYGDIFDLEEVAGNSLRAAIIKLIKDEMVGIGKQQLYAHCPGKELWGEV